MRGAGKAKNSQLYDDMDDSVDVDAIAGLSPDHGRTRQEPRKRRAVPLGVRFRVFQRDGFRCRYCGVGAAEAVLHIDHVLAVVRGGSNHESNLVTSCRDCNLGKSARVVQHPKTLGTGPTTVHVQIRHDARPIEGSPAPVYWMGDQWKVTSDGIECLENSYFIEAHRVWEENRGYGWLDHMREKEWVLMFDFEQALEFARQLFVLRRKPQVSDG